MDSGFVKDEVMLCLCLRLQSRVTVMRANVYKLLVILAFGALGFTPAVSAQTAAVSGTVTDAQNGQPLSGAQVYLPGLDRGTLTGEDGRFRITKLPAGEHRLRAQLLGYQMVTRTVQLTAGQVTETSFQMRVSGIEMEEIVVTGTGGPVQRQSLGNVLESIRAEDYTNAPVIDVADILTERVTGLNVMFGGGETGSETSLRLRGPSSVTKTNEPVIYIDGVRVNNTPDSIGGQPFTVTQLGFIDPSSVERVEVLKGASATTLYGSEASTGVVQIFTRRGSEQGAPSSYRFWTHQGGISIPNSRMPINATFTGDEIATSDARDAVIRTGHRQEYGASASGRVSNVGYYATGSYTDEMGPVITNDLQDYNGRLTIDADVSESFGVFSTLGFMDRSLALPGSRKIPNGPFPNALLAFPFATSDDRPYGEIFVPISNGRQVQRDVSLQNVLGSAAVEFAPSDAFNSRLSVSLENMEEEFDYLEPFGVDIEGSTDGEKRISHDSEIHVTVESRNNWETAITDSWSSRLSVGGQLFFDKKQNDLTAAEGFPGPGLSTLGTASTVTQFTEFQRETWSGGVYVQEQLSLGDRLYLTGGVRADDNTAFGDNVGIQTFPKASVSYVLSNESFWDVPFWNTLRLRGSFGTAGLPPGEFDAQRTFASSIYEGSSAVVPSNVGNPDLKPERSREFEGGFDAAFLDGRISAQFTYFNQKTNDLLVPKAFPPSEGFLQRQLVNAGELTNEGIEASVNGDLVRSNNLIANLRVSASTLSSEVDLAGAGPIRPGYFRYRNYLISGFSPGAFFGTQLDEDNPYDIVVGGVTNPDDLSGFNSTDQIAVNVLTNSAGNDSLAFLGEAQPDVSGSFGLDLTMWQRLHVNTSFTYQVGSHAHNLTGKLRTELGIRQELAELQQDLANASGDDEKRQLAREFAHMSPRSRSNWIQDNDFVRLSELAVAYSLPDSLAAQFLGAREVSVVAAGSNLALWTDYTGSDPISNEAGATNFVRNTDFLQAPLPKRYSLELRVGF